MYSAFVFAIFGFRLLLVVRVRVCVRVCVCACVSPHRHSTLLYSTPTRPFSTPPLQHSTLLHPYSTLLYTLPLLHSTLYSAPGLGAVLVSGPSVAQCWHNAPRVPCLTPLRTFALLTPLRTRSSGPASGHLIVGGLRASGAPASEQRGWGRGRCEGARVAAPKGGEGGRTWRCPEGG